MTHASKPHLSKIGLSFLTFAALGLAAFNPAQAQTTADANILHGGTVTATNPYSTATFAPSNLTDSSTTPFVFADNGLSPETVSITGFNSAIGTLRFFDAPDFLYRNSPSVVVGYSSTANAGVGGVYTLLNSGNPLVLATSNGGQDYLTATSPAQTQLGPASTGTNTIHFSDLTGLGIPAGTQSLMLTFTQAPADTTNNGQLSGAALTEIQGFAPVPEASTTVGFGLILAMGGLAFVARKRSAKV